MGAVVAAVAAVKGEFQHFHAGVLALGQQLAHIVGQETQVLGNDAGAAQFLFNGGKQAVAWAGAPAAMLGGLIAVRDGVVPGEAAEVIDAQEIVDAAQVADAAHPPAVAGSGHGVPVKQRVAPQLAGGGETIRRAAGHLDRQQVFVQLKLLRAAPDIHTVRRYVDGQVADDLDAPGIGVGFQFFPLGVEEILHSLPEIDACLMIAAGLIQIGRFAQAQRAFPLQPGLTAVGIFQCHEQGVVRQPESVVRQKLLVILWGVGQQTGAGAA